MIRNVITRGYGNGTYFPGISFVPTRGFLSGEEAEAIGPGCWAVGMVHLLGCGPSQVHIPGSGPGQAHILGNGAGQRFC